MKKLFKRGRKPSQVSSQGLLKFADSISFNAQNYIPKTDDLNSLTLVFKCGLIILC